jgi:hypothetical protein
MSKALSVGLGVPASPGTYSAALDGLTRVNEVLMRRDPSIPPLYATGARWELRPEDPSENRWRYADEVAAEGWGDCQALACYRAAELRVSGEDPGAHVRVYPTGKNKYHAVVARSNGFVEDPSVALGMIPFPGAPMTTDQLPAVQGPGGGSPGIDSAAIMGAQRQIARAVCGLHPVAAICGIGEFGDETGLLPKIARVKDVAPEYARPTVHITGHRKGGMGYKGVHRVPLRDGTVLVGMTRTHKHPADCVGDLTGLISDVAHTIAKTPALLFALSPFSAGTTLALQDPTVQHALGSIGRTVKNEVRGKKDSSGSAGDSGGWPEDWSVSGAPSHRDMAVVGWGLSNLASIVTDPLKAAGNFVAHPSLGNLARLGISPLTGSLHTIYRPSSGSPAAVPPPQAQQGMPGGGLPFRLPPAMGTAPFNQPSQPQYVPPGFDPSTYPAVYPATYPGAVYNATTYVPPGFDPSTYPAVYPSTYPGAVYNATTHSYQQSYPGWYNQDPNAVNAPTAADFGLSPFGEGGGGAMGPTEAENLAAAFSDPQSMSAYASFDPSAEYGF